MSTARLILVALILATPTILLLDGAVVDGILAAVTAGTLTIVAMTIPPGETEHLVTLTRPAAAIAVIPLIWMVVQILSLNALGLANPIWESAQVALGHPVSGSISIDPGTTLVALTRYLSTLAVTLLSAAVAVDRQRCEWILFAAVGATALIAIVLLSHDVLGLHFLSENSGSPRDEAVDCVALGVIISATAAIRTFERYETRRNDPTRSVPVLKQTAAACGAALVLCCMALFFNAAINAIFAIIGGVLMLIAVGVIRRFGGDTRGFSTIALPAVIAVVLLIANAPGVRTVDLSLGFATHPSSLSVLLTQRILADVPWTGIGAGNFAAISPIYRDIEDAATIVAPTAAAAIVVELGRPMLWAIVAAITGAAGVLLRAALRRGRDSFFPAAGASTLVTLLILSFGNAGLFGTAISIIAAAVIGSGLAQSKSRTVQPNATLPSPRAVG